MNIGARIKRIRENLEMTQEEFAKKIHKSVRSVKSYEKNVGITIDLLETIAETFDISVLSLFTISDDLFKLFVLNNNLRDLPPKKMQKLNTEFNAFLDFLASKYTE